MQLSRARRTNGRVSSSSLKRETAEGEEACSLAAALHRVQWSAP